MTTSSAFPPPPPPVIPAGWYPDPQAPNFERWWDGERWTEHSSSLAPARAPEPSHSVTSRPKPRHLWARAFGIVTLTGFAMWLSTLAVSFLVSAGLGWQDGQLGTVGEGRDPDDARVGTFLTTVVMVFWLIPVLTATAIAAVTRTVLFRVVAVLVPAVCIGFALNTWSAALEPWSTDFTPL